MKTSTAPHQYVKSRVSDFGSRISEGAFVISQRNPKPASGSFVATRNPVFGFTLVEILLTVALIGILAGLGVPQLFGIYARQQVANSANELVTNIKQARNKALANDQGAYASSAYSDCTADPNGHPYVDAYQIYISGNGTYQTQYYFRPHPTDNNSINCAVGSPTTVSTVNLPSDVQFNQGVGTVLSYKVVSGKLTVTPGTTTSLTLYSTKISQSALTYYICINAQTVYAQTTSCPS